MFAKNVEELTIYQIALQLAKETDQLIKQIPDYWRIKESDQILRSSSSVPSNIAEGFPQRFYPRQFIKYLYISMGSSDESKTHIEKMKNNFYVRQEIADEYIKRYKNLSIKILNLIIYLKKKHSILL
jgi:four helix bundle protein